MTVPMLEVRQVSRRFATRGGRSGSATWALRGVSLQVPTGRTLGVVGESGSGKSTLARLLVALDTPTEGEILHQGLRIDGRRERELRGFRRSVQMVFQDPMSSLDPRMRVHDILAEPLRALGLVADEAEQVRQLLVTVGLPPEAARRYPHQFSGGQRQRIAIARALGPSPQVLVADEPVSALDVSVRAAILNLLRHLVRELNLTMVFISHDMGVVRHLCDEIAVLRHGELIEHRPASEIFAAPREQYTRELLAASPRIRPWAPGGGSSR
ncbi:MAG: ATP-binding cassette domain-containing protein [Actinomycetes bacterium]